MKHSTPDPLLTLNEVARTLGFTRYRASRVLTDAGLRSQERAGLKAPGYRQSEVLTLKAEIEKQTAAVAA